MILEVDAGNTRVKWRMVDPSGCIVKRGADTSFDEETLRELVAAQPLRARIGSVRSSEWGARISLLMQKQFCVEPEFVVSTSEREGVINGYLVPEKLGVDRWLAMLAARRRRPAEALLVVDCGSAVTLDFISTEGLHLGGYIVPGIGLQLESLSRGTTLPGYNKPAWHECSPGRDTEAAVTKGILRMLSAWVIEEARSNFEGKAKVVITGGDGLGLATNLGRHGLDHEYIEDLVLDGLQVALP
jgi:type III pantothenate kinase